MSSTSSSAERGFPRRSATEILASRYRHLFVLPSTPFLLIYAGAITLLLSLGSRGAFGIVTFVPAFIVLGLSVVIISSALFLVDSTTIANFRRTTAILLAGSVLWLISATCGIVYASVTGSPSTVTGSFVFGAFLCGGFEFLVINGAFTEMNSLSLVLAVVHPVPTLLILRFSDVSGHPNLFPFIVGAGAFTILGSFTLLLRRRKTSRGFSAVRLFQAFMKTWAGGAPADLEAMIAEHSESTELTTKVMRFKYQDGDIFFVLPGAHPGPFHPIGSYNLPGVISKAFGVLGPVLTLHRPGGHERNIATGRDTKDYAERVREFAEKIQVTKEKSLLRGPFQVHIGKATVGSAAFSNDLLITITFSPLGADDIEAGVEAVLQDLAGSVGFDASIVDAHNSLGHDQVSPEVEESPWNDLFRQTSEADPKPFRIAYSHSGEVKFKGGEDVTEDGLGLVMLEVGGSRHVLLLGDANNAVPELRQQTAKALQSGGYNLMEFCTSDSHDLAAMGLTVSRGYKALGEATPPNLIAKAVVDMAKLAEARLSACLYGSGKFTSKTRIFGAQALEEFAGITQASSKLGRTYLRFVAVSLPLLLLLSVLF